MKLNEFIEQGQLNEGLVFLKNSKRLFKLATNLKKRNSKVRSPEAGNLIRDIEKVAYEFEDIEEAFKEAESKEDKEIVKEKYKKLVIKYKKLIKTINQESVIKALKVIGGITVVAASIIAIYFAIINFGNAFGNTEIETLSAIKGSLKAAEEIRPTLSDREAAALDKEIRELVQQKIVLQSKLRSAGSRLAVEAAPVVGFVGLSAIANKLFSKSRKNAVADSTRRTFERLKQEAKSPK